jgi:hypothetical protein
VLRGCTDTLAIPPAEQGFVTNVDFGWTERANKKLFSIQDKAAGG